MKEGKVNEDDVGVEGVAAVDDEAVERKDGGENEEDVGEDPKGKVGLAEKEASPEENRLEEAASDESEDVERAGVVVVVGVFESDKVVGVEVEVEVGIEEFNANISNFSQWKGC